MAWCLFVAKPLPYQCWLIVNWTPGNIIQWKWILNSIIFIQENAFEIVVHQSGSRFVQVCVCVCVWGGGMI